MKSLNINDLKNMRIDYSNVVNHTLDVSSNSILSINNWNKEKQFYEKPSAKRKKAKAASKARQKKLLKKRFEEFGF